MRVPSLALAAILTMSALAGCGPEDDGERARAGDPAESESAWPSDATISEEEARSAVLVLDDLSDEFVVAPEDDDDDDSDTDMGCFMDFAGMEEDEDEEDEEETDVEVDYEPSTDLGMPLVSQTIFTEDLDEEQASLMLDKMADLMDDCTSVDTTDDDGTRIQLEIMLDRDSWAPGSDQQVNLAASGSMDMQGITLPMTLNMSMVRVGDVVTALFFFDMAREAGSAHKALVTRACERLVAVIDGDDAPEGGPLLEDYPIGAALEGLDPGQQQDV